MKKNHGMALIAVLWLTAAIALIASSLTQSLKSEIKSNGVAKRFFNFKVKADAVMLIALQRIDQKQPDLNNFSQNLNVNFLNENYSVSIEPGNGLIDLNSAKQSLLADLFKYVANQPEDQAKILASALIDYKEMKGPQGTKKSYQAVEDVLNIPLITYEIYRKIYKCLTAELVSGSGKVNPSAAPMDVLMVLTAGNASLAKTIYSYRFDMPAMHDFTMLNPEYYESTSSKNIHLKVTSMATDHLLISRDWNVYMLRDPKTALPWRFLSSSIEVLDEASSLN